MKIEIDGILKSDGPPAEFVEEFAYEERKIKRWRSGVSVVMPKSDQTVETDDNWMPAATGEPGKW